jgi:hypothetical protein
LAVALPEETQNLLMSERARFKVEKQGKSYTQSLARLQDGR